MLRYPYIDPVAFELGPLAVRWYGLAYLAGFAVAWWLMLRRGRRPGSGWTEEQIGDLVFYCALGVILGGRLGHVLFYAPLYYLAQPLEILMVWRGGMSFHGGVIGILIAAAWYGRKLGKGLFQVTDFLTPAGPVGLFFGRIANFVNGELWGRPTALPWGMVFPDPRAGDVARHPSQLYEAVLEGLVLFIVLWWFSGRPRPERAVTGLFFIGYGVFRFLVEYVREPETDISFMTGDWLTLGQVLTLPMIGVGGWLLLTAYRARTAAAR
ncbi:MAG: prolipoprotein diacylglyceryl transferase [Gammaproteobacteria bacterium]